MKYSIKFIFSTKLDANYGQTDEKGELIPSDIITVQTKSCINDIRSATELKFSELKAEIAKKLPESLYNTESEITVLKMTDLKDDTVINESDVICKVTTLAPDLSKVTSVEDKNQKAMIRSFYSMNDIYAQKLNATQVKMRTPSVKPLNSGAAV
jgi:hypothetical protein